MSTFDDDLPDVVRALAVTSQSHKEKSPATADVSPFLPHTS